MQTLITQPMSVVVIVIIRTYFLLFVVLLCVNVVHADNLSSEYAEEFERLVRRLDYNPDDLIAGDKLRSICRHNGISDQCIDALNELAKKHPKNKSIRYQAALAYVDEVPGHSLFKQGWLSSRSMDHMDSVIEVEPNDWMAYYIRGLNGLYWPRSFRKLPRSIEDLKKSITLSDQLPKGLVKPYHGLSYIALGDAYVKNGDLLEGRKIYGIGRTIFESIQLDKRIKMEDQELEAFVKELRNTNQRVDTEVSFLIDGGAEKL